MTSMAKEFVTDVTVVFTSFVVLVPLLYVDGIQGAIKYLTTPMMLGSFALLANVLFATHGKGNTKSLSPTEARMANWFLMNGVYFNLFLDVVSGQFQMMDEMSRQYLKVEPRYEMGIFTVAGASVFMTSMLELIFQSPLGLLAYYAFHHKKPYRYAASMILSVLHICGVWYFYIPEAIQSFPHLGGWPTTFAEAVSFDRLLFFWFGFWFCGLLWIIVPAGIVVYSWMKLSNLVDIAENKASSPVKAKTN